MAVTINDVRFSYCNLFQPKTTQDGTLKYGVTILIPKTNVQAKAIVDAAIEAATIDGIQKKWGGQRPALVTTCIHDGDGGRPTDHEPYGEECRGCWVLTATNKDKPFVVDAMVQNIINPVEVYSGMWGNVSLNFYSYNNKKKGIGCGLNGVQKTADGDPLTSHVTAEDAFKPVGAASAFTQPAMPQAYAQAPGQAYSNQAQQAYATPAQQAYMPQGYQTQAQAQAHQPLAQAQTPAAVDPITGQPLTF